MNKDKIKDVLIVLILVVLLYNTYATHTLRQELARATQQLTSWDSKIDSEINWVRDDISDLHAQLESSSSMLSESSIDIAYGDNQYIVTATATPKELANDENLYLELDIEGEIYSAEFIGNSASVGIPLSTYRATPTIVIHSENGTRNETLSDIIPHNYLATYLDNAHISRISDDVAHLEFEVRSNYLDIQDFVSARIKVVDTQVLAEENSASGTATAVAKDAYYDLTPLDEIDGEEIVVENINGLASADISKYYTREDGIYYDIYIEIVDVYGNKYTTMSNMMSFSHSSNSFSTSISDGHLYIIT